MHSFHAVGPAPMYVTGSVRLQRMPDVLNQSLPVGVFHACSQFQVCPEKLA